MFFKILILMLLKKMIFGIQKCYNFGLGNADLFPNSFFEGYGSNTPSHFARLNGKGWRCNTYDCHLQLKLR